MTALTDHTIDAASGNGYGRCPAEPVWNSAAHDERREGFVRGRCPASSSQTSVADSFLPPMSSEISIMGDRAIIRTMPRACQAQPSQTQPRRDRLGCGGDRS